MPTKHRKYFPTASKTTSQVSGEFLVPVMAFLHKSGIPKAKLLAECRTAIRLASSSKLKVVHFDIGQEVTGIVNRWLRDPAYLNSSGRPNELSIQGPRSVASLVRACESNVSPTAALSLMVKFGIARKIASGKYRLIRRLMDYGHPEYLPFEPNFRFLADAARVSTKKLRDADIHPGLFWQCADNPRIDARKAREFLQFAQSRGLSFMHEINDWLDEHECKDSQAGKRTVRVKRLGVGLFGICR